METKKANPKKNPCLTQTRIIQMSIEIRVILQKDLTIVVPVNMEVEGDQKKAEVPMMTGSVQETPVRGHVIATIATRITGGPRSAIVMTIDHMTLTAAAQTTVTDPMNVTVTTTGTGTITKVTVVMETVAMETIDMAVEIGVATVMETTVITMGIRVKGVSTVTRTTGAVTVEVDTTAADTIQTTGEVIKEDTIENRNDLGGCIEGMDTQHFLVRCKVVNIKYHRKCIISVSETCYGIQSIFKFICSLLATKHNVKASVLLNAIFSIHR